MSLPYVHLGLAVRINSYNSQLFRNYFIVVKQSCSIKDEITCRDNLYRDQEISHTFLQTSLTELLHFTSGYY